RCAPRLILGGKCMIERRKNLKRLVSAGALIVGLLTLLVACGGGAPQPHGGPGKISGMLVYPGGSNPDPSLPRSGEAFVSGGTAAGIITGSASASANVAAEREPEVRPGEVIVMYQSGLRTLATDNLRSLGVPLTAVRAVAAGQSAAQL